MSSPKFPEDSRKTDEEILKEAINEGTYRDWICGIEREET